MTNLRELASKHTTGCFAALVVFAVGWTVVLVRFDIPSGITLAVSFFFIMALFGTSLISRANHEPPANRRAN